jgi:hypothetical protein
MNSMNSRLGSAVERFASQPGVTPGQVDQLRRALIADRSLADRFNEAASSGLIKDFFVAQQSETLPVGRLDTASGALRLPASALRATGTEPSNDLQSVVRVQSMIAHLAANESDKTGADTNASFNKVQNLQVAINQSPVLAQEIKRAATTPDPADPAHYSLENFAILPPGTGAGGTYVGATHTMNLLDSSLAIATSPPAVRDRQLRELTFTVGHEVRHSFNHGTTTQAWKDFKSEVESISHTVSPVHDYTGALRDHLQVARTDEAQANIAGWNALLSRERSMDAQFEIKNMPLILGRANDFLEVKASGETVPRQGISFNSDGSLTETRQNVEAMGVHYFDRPSPNYVRPGVGDRQLGLGSSHVLDYKNYYLKEPIETIVAAEQNAPLFQGHKPELTINAGSLGLKEDLLEREGLNLGSRKDSVPYFDSSQLPSAPHSFQSHSGASAAVGGAQQRPIADSLSGRPASMAIESPLARELKNMLPAETSMDRISQIALAAKEGGIEAGRIRSIDVVGEKLMLTGVTPGSHASVDLASPPPPAAQSDMQLSAIVEQQQQQTQTQHAAQQQQGPTMSLGY